MKNKGFTLIELLAVIVILAIIAVIAMPVIMNLIDRSRYGAFGVSKKNIERAAELYYARNAASVIWDNDISYVEIGTLKSKKYLAQNVVDVLTDMEISDDTKILLYREGRKVSYSLQLYDETFFDWYQKEMIKAVQKDNVNLPANIGDKATVDLEELMNKGLVDELRLPLELENRCVGYVEVEKKAADDYGYNAYVDCLTNASTFASHYVSYGGKNLDSFTDVQKTSDGGYIAVGNNNSDEITKYGTLGKGKYDAIIVKFKSDGTVEWSQNFGGTNSDYFYDVVEINNGYVAVGTTSSTDGDLSGIYKGGTYDALVVKYDDNGNVVGKVSYGTSAETYREAFNRVIFDGTNLVLVGTMNISNKDGDATGLVSNLASEVAIIIKMDLNLNTVWRNLFGGTKFDYFTSVIKTSDNGYMAVGHSSSSDYDMVGAKPVGASGRESVIVKYNDAGVLQSKNFFIGDDDEYFYDVVEVNDGYIATGYSNSSLFDMAGLNKADNGTYDGVVVKYDKSLTNKTWIKSFGGTNDDMFKNIIVSNTNGVIVVGSSKSDDNDMNGIAISTGGYNNAIMVNYDSSNGNILSKKVFGGSNSDVFNAISRVDGNNYIVAGESFSSDQNLKDFNKGHSDAIIVSYNNSLQLENNLNEPVILIDRLKTIVPNYGPSISNSYTNIYTSNNPGTDLGNWCSSSSNYGAGYNYPYGLCLVPFNSDDIKLLMNKDTINGYKKVFIGENEYSIDIQPDNKYNWYRLLMNFVNTSGVEISNFKFKFSDGYVGSIRDSVAAGYIEPLVVVSNTISRLVGDNVKYFFPAPMGILDTNGTTGVGSVPSIYVSFKPKKSQLTSVTFTSNKGTTTDGFMLYELRNFDMSITPTE
ncbi:MAG: prepilin-type N-terminal cleavage/methylation domain-containing protein [Ignavibacteriales bacterium]